MSDLFPPDAPGPLSPLYPFNEPGQPVVLYEGAIGGLASGDVTGSVELSCAPRPGIEWHVEPGAPPQFANQPAVTLALRRRDGDVLLPGAPRGIGGGWSNGTVAGRADVPLYRIVAHWFNLPRWHGLLRLTAPPQDGSQRWWSDRWVTQVSGWRITLDARPDHQRVWADLHKTDVYVMTHGASPPGRGRIHRRRGFDGEIARKGVPAPIQVGTRWVVERTHSWMNGYGKLRRCTERSAKIVDFYLYLAAALVTIRQLIQRARNRYRWDTRPTTQRLK